MSRFLREGLRTISPYTPGEQPKMVGRLVKLNTNESPYPPSPAVLDALGREEAARLRLYSDPTAEGLNTAIAETFSLSRGSVISSNGSDEILAFAIDAFCERERGIRITDITYGFYPIFAALYGVKVTTVPLREDFTVPVESFLSGKETVVLANPNAQTGIALPLSEIRRIVESDPDRLVIIDEAYVDFGGESAVSLISEHSNLLVIRTFSKSRSLAGARIGFALGDSALIRDLETVRNSFNPYNLNRLSLLAGEAAMRDVSYFVKTRDLVVATREKTAGALRERGFLFPPSSANFILARHPAIGGEALYLALKARGVLVRHFGDERIRDYVRITIGSDEEMRIFFDAVDDIFEKKGELS